MQPKMAKASASYEPPANSPDALSAMHDMAEFGASDNRPCYNRWPNHGTRQTISYHPDTEYELDQTAVCWFEDGAGCRTPAAWRAFWLDGTTWKPAKRAETFGSDRDQWNVVRFEPVKTRPLCIAVQCRQGISAGVVEWRVGLTPLGIAQVQQRLHLVDAPRRDERLAVMVVADALVRASARRHASPAASTVVRPR
ncbi:MAG: hypothetical protein NT029_14450 [Armatimonadetes bacterium]|nr:hypothetical protein [Armatimonadota bacterium]